MHDDPNARPHLSRRRLLELVPTVGAVMWAAGCSEPDRTRTFGLSMTGVDVESVGTTLHLGDEVGRSVDVLNFYDAFHWEADFPVALVTAIDDAGCVPEITWEPWNPHAGPDQPDYALAQIAGGRYDLYIARWAEAAAHYDKPLLMRFAHEMNGDWYPWSVRRAGGDPAGYVAAFQRVHRAFGYAGASKVEWVWSPNVVLSGDDRALIESYPGDEFVDLVGLDGYNFGDDRSGRQWTDPAELFGASLALLDTIAPSKAVWINETGSTDLGGDKAAWIADAIRYLDTTRVEGLMWFEVASPGEQDWRLTATRETANAAASALARW